MRLRLGLVTVLVPLIAIVLAVVGGRQAGESAAGDARSSLTVGFDSLPADTQIAGFTDWSRIRRLLEVDEPRNAAERSELVDGASLRDLSTRSVIGPYAEEMHNAYGWSAADLLWEAYGQGQASATMVARLDDSVSRATIRSNLTKLGYVRDGRVWSIRADTSAVSSDLASTLGAIALVPDRDLVIAASEAAQVSEVLGTIDRDTPSLLSVRSAADVTRALAGADSVLVQAGPSACRSTTLETQDAEVLSQARAALGRADALVEPEFAGRALDGGTRSSEVMRFAFGFRSPSIAAQQAKTRASLAVGPFIGRSGRVEDSLVPLSSTARGSTAVLRFRHDPDSTAYMTGEGPLLFAGCPL